MNQAISLLVITLSLACSASAQSWTDFLNPRRCFGGCREERPPAPPQPPAVVDCVIQDRTYEAGSKPRVEEKDWKTAPCLLTVDLSQAQAANVQEWDKFTAARVKATTPPTKAYWLKKFGSNTGVQAMNPSVLSLKPQAEAVLAKVKALTSTIGDGRCAVELVEMDPVNFTSPTVYEGDGWVEERRHWYIIVGGGRDGLYANLIREMYASDTIESVRKRLNAELVEACRR